MAESTDPIIYFARILDLVRAGIVIYLFAIHNTFDSLTLIDKYGVVRPNSIRWTAVSLTIARVDNIHKINKTIVVIVILSEIHVKLTVG